GGGGVGGGGGRGGAGAGRQEGLEHGDVPVLDGGDERRMLDVAGDVIEPQAGPDEAERRLGLAEIDGARQLADRFVFEGGDGWLSHRRAMVISPIPSIREALSLSWAPIAGVAD